MGTNTRMISLDDTIMVSLDDTRMIFADDTTMVYLLDTRMISLDNTTMIPLNDDGSGAGAKYKEDDDHSRTFSYQSLTVIIYTCPAVMPRQR